jgi:hypothetical protein
LFKQAGIDVTVAGFIVQEPIISLFKSIDIDIINPIDNPQFLFQKSFDLVWGHHWPIVGFVLFELDIKTKYLILGSLSPYEPIEAIWMLINQSDLVWFNSFENYNLQTAAFSNENLLHKSFVLCNSLTDEWFSEYQSQTRNLHRIAVISNHVPQEIKEVISLLKERNIETKVLGFEYQQELVTPKMIDSFDAVITIGHSVQKSLARGVPVYCYDRFGGPGWITTNNIEKAEKLNFSGRCCNRKLSASDILDEIIGGFESASKEVFRDLTIDNYSLKKNVSQLISTITYSSEYKNFSDLITEKKVCHSYINEKFNNIIPHPSNVTGVQKKILHTSVQIEDLDKIKVLCFGLDPIKPNIFLWDISTHDPFNIGGILLLDQVNCRVEDIYGVFLGSQISAKIGMYSPGVGQSYPNIPFSYSSRFSLTIPNVLEGNSVELFARLTNTDVIKLAVIEFS